MTAIRSQHARVFEQLIAEHSNLLAASLIAGTCSDYAAYTQLVGRLQGLGDALKISEQADFNINGEEPDGGA